MVDFTQYNEMKEGTKEDTVISRITEGTQEDFRTEEYFNSFKDKADVKEARKQKCIKIETENMAELVVSLPSGKTIHPKSNLAAFKRTYGKYPGEGMKVTTKLDENGFHRVVLEV